MILGKSGELTMDYDDIKGIVYNLNVHLRIKIFKKEGFNHANFNIEYIKGKTKRATDYITNFKAYTYNLVDGSIDKKKLDKKDIYNTNF